MVTMTETAAKKIADLRLEEGKPEWGLRIRDRGRRLLGHVLRARLGRPGSRRATTSSRRTASRSTSTSTARRISQGSEIDFVDNNMMGAGFAIKNPNVKSSCGCGQSHRF